MNQENAGDQLARLGTDALKWAQEFVKINGPLTNHDGTVDTGEGGDTLHVWFCNAIEAGHLAGAVAAGERETDKEAIANGPRESARMLMGFRVMYAACRTDYPDVGCEMGRFASARTALAWSWRNRR